MLTSQWMFDGLLCLLVLIPLTECTNTDGSGRKTYVVRYKNGDNTIPVTVVLDYKKQAEYVINMNTRTPSKSVTFYDFKQKSIAYKDMRNKECFIGKLTNETLQSENEVLQRLQNPLEIKPQTLQLDPTRSTLTPTEVRNMAGQKIAMFCRKKATWLLQEPSGLTRNRRQTIQRIEKTYSHHGHEKYEYSRYGHETYEVSHLPQSSKQQGVPGLDNGPQNGNGHLPINQNTGKQSTNPRVYQSPSNNQQVYRRPPRRHPQGQGDIHQRRTADNNIPNDNILSGLHPPPPSLVNSQLYSHPLRYSNAQNSTISLYQQPHQSSPLIPEAHGFDSPSSGTSHGQRTRQPPSGHQLPTVSGKPDYLPQFSSVHNTGNLSSPTGHLRPFQQISDHSLHAVRPEPTTPSPYHHVEAPERSRKTPLSVSERINDIDHRHHRPSQPGGVIGQPISNHSLLNTGRELEINPYNYNNVTNNRPRIDSDVILRPDLYDLNRNAYDRDVISTNERLTSAVNSPTNQQPSHSLHQTKFVPPRRYQSTGNHRADIPSEDSGNFHPNSRNGLRSRLNTTRNDGRLMPLPGIINKNGRHHNVLKLFTPDEIVIDVGKIPKKPEFPLTNVQKKRPTTGANGLRDRPWNHRQAEEQSSGRVWHRTYSNGQPPAGNNGPNDFLGNRAVYSRRRPLPPAVPPVMQPQVPQVALPPGVSVYPRHPNAPFADLAGTSAARRPVMAVGNVYPQSQQPQPPPHHRQRHLRKKQRSFLTCCAPGYAGNQLQQCCNRQKSMMLPHHQRGSSFTVRSCCSPSTTRTARRMKQHHRQGASKNIDQIVVAPQNKKIPTTEEMCDMKMMCRTLYQSTKAVKVCRQPNVPGC